MRTRDLSGRFLDSHGMADTRLYFVRAAIINRCESPKNKSWPRYGGRGIRICHRWRTSFNAFVRDLGVPKNGLQLDRIDNDGHYSCGKCEECRERGWPANCRWATRVEQIRNRPYTNRITFRGITKTIVEWSEQTGIPRLVLWTRLRKLKWPARKILTTPVQKQARGGASIKCLRNIHGGMMSRCHGNALRHPNYAGRGITVCVRWQASDVSSRERGAGFKNFLADMGPRPPGTSLDRIDNDRGYWCGRPECPECGPLGRKPNCRWADRKTQANNKRHRAHRCTVKKKDPQPKKEK